uniref:Tachykinin-related peptide 4 n=1 Tax=Rhodnius prolixus TaxID=13249 RepID=TRP4_RHOPR|nr:RecName: Full=Tachykinin-related peptide 4; Short=Rhopr-TRP-4 [Rhodnius prolixus]
TPSDGFMGMR